MRLRPLREDLYLPAARDLRFLLSRGYPRESALKFVGDHYQLHQRERDLLYRGVYPLDVASSRKRKMITPSALKGRRLVVDGYNVLITLESALKNKDLLLADDGFTRDVSRVFRGFRPTALTKHVWTTVLTFLKDYPPKETIVLLDSPISKSGELALRICRWFAETHLNGKALTTPCTEREMLKIPGIYASADSFIIEKAEWIFDLAGHLIRRRLRLSPIRLSRSKVNQPA